MTLAKPPNIFIDMDGVLVDFDKEFQKHMPGLTEDDDWEWEDLHKLCPDIYAIAPLMPDAHVFMDYIYEIGLDERTFILTAIPKRWNWPNVTKHKREWILNHFPWIPHQNIRFGPYAEDKQYHCWNSNDILIDDKIRNIQQWRDRCGTGIHHVSGEWTMRQLRDILISREAAG